MSNSRRPQSSFEERVDWLKKHLSLRGKPKLEVLRAMQRAGLLSKTSYLGDCKLKEEFHAAEFYFDKEKP